MKNVKELINTLEKNLKELKEKQFVQQKRVAKELLLNSSKFDYELGILKEYNELIEKTYYSLCDLKNLCDL